MNVADIVATALGHPNAARTLAVAALVAARIAPLALLAPFLGLRSAPALLRSFVVVALTLTMTPFALAHARIPSPPNALVLTLLLAREALVGTAFAIVASMPFHAIEAGGRLVDLHRGANLAEVIAPPTGERTSPLGDLALLATLALYASVGGLRVAFERFTDTFVSLPIGTGVAANGTMFLEAARAAANALSFAATVATPAAVALVATEIGLGLVARSVPRIAVFFLGMPVRATVGLLVAFASIGITMRVGLSQALAALDVASRVLR